MTTLTVDEIETIAVTDLEPTNDQELECFRPACHNAAEWMVHWWCKCVDPICNGCLQDALERGKLFRFLGCWVCNSGEQNGPNVRDLVPL